MKTTRLLLLFLCCWGWFNQAKAQDIAVTCRTYDGRKVEYDIIESKLMVDGYPQDVVRLAVNDLYISFYYLDQSKNIGREVKIDRHTGGAEWEESYFNVHYPPPTKLAKGVCTKRQPSRRAF